MCCRSHNKYQMFTNCCSYRDICYHMQILHYFVKVNVLHKHDVAYTVYVMNVYYLKYSK